MLGIHAVNPDESIIASVAWNLWTEGRLGTDLLAGAIPGIEHHLYWTQPLYYIVLAGWLGLWGLSLLSVRSLSTVLAFAVLGLLYYEGRLHRHRAAWLASALLLCDLFFDYAGTIGRMDMLAIALTTGAIVLIGIPERGRRHTIAAGALAAGAMLTHPLGAAAGVAVFVTIAIRAPRSLVLLIVGALPLVLLWLSYISLDPVSFGDQMGLQWARKADIPHSPVYNISRFIGFCGDWWPMAVVLWVGGTVGLLLDSQRKLPWLAAAASLWPVVLFFGEIVYPAYLAPAAAVGLASLAVRIRRGPHLVIFIVLVRLSPTVIDPPPLGGIDPDYPAYCAWIEEYLGEDQDVLLGLLPDPWFGLRHREDLRFHHAPPVVLSEVLLHAYVYEADVTVVGGYNPPGFFSVLHNWEQIGVRGQKLWVMEHGGMVDFGKLLAESQ